MVPTDMAKTDERHSDICGRKAIWLFLILCLAACCAVGFSALGTKSVWVDEAHTLWDSETLDAGGKVTKGSSLTYWLASFGRNSLPDSFSLEAKLRLPFAVVAISGLILFFIAVRAAAGPCAAAFSTGLFAASPFFVWHMSEARHYAPGIAVTGLALCGFAALTHGPPLRRTILFAGILSIAYMLSTRTHESLCSWIGTALFCTFLIKVALWGSKHRETLKNVAKRPSFWVVSVLVAAIFAGLAVAAMWPNRAALHGKALVWWQAPLSPGLTSSPEFCISLTARLISPVYEGRPYWVWTGDFALLAAGAVFLGRKRPVILAWTACVVLLPLCGIFLIKFRLPFQAKYVFYFAPLIAALEGWGVAAAAQSKSRAARWFVFAALAWALAGRGWALYTFAQGERMDSKGPVLEFVAEAPESARLISLGGASMNAMFYQEQYDLPGERFISLPVFWRCNHLYNFKRFQELLAAHPNSRVHLSWTTEATSKAILGWLTDNALVLDRRPSLQAVHMETVTASMPADLPGDSGNVQLCRILDMPLGGPVVSGGAFSSLSPSIHTRHVYESPIMRAVLRYNGYVEYAPPEELGAWRAARVALRHLGGGGDLTVWLIRGEEIRAVSLAPGQRKSATVDFDSLSTASLRIALPGSGHAPATGLRIDGAGFLNSPGEITEPLEALKLKRAEEPAFASWDAWDFKEMPGLWSAESPPLVPSVAPPLQHPDTRIPYSFSIAPRLGAGNALAVRLGREPLAYNARSPAMPVEGGQRLLLRFEARVSEQKGWSVYARLEFCDSGKAPVGPLLWLNQEPLSGLTMGWRSIYVDTVVPRDAVTAQLELTHLPGTDFRGQTSALIEWSLPERLVLSD